MALADLQAAIQSYVLRADPVAPSIVRGTAQFPIDARLDVYRHAFHERLAGALETTYPALRATLGEEKFRALAYKFIAAHKPTHFSIRYFGAELEAFLAARNGIRHQGLSELARWEWTLAIAFDAADVEPATTATLARFAPEEWERLRFEFAPSLQRFALSSNAVQWWRAMTQDAKCPSRWRKAKQQQWAVWRTDLRTQFRSLDAAESAAIGAAMTGHTFGQLCASLDAEDAAVQAAMLLQSWFRDGWIVGVELAP